MGRVAMSPLLVLGAAIGLLVAACAPSPGSNESGAFGQQAGSTPPRYGTPYMGTGTPGAEIRGAAATAVATRMLGTPGPVRIQGTLRDMDQFQDQLRSLASGTPTPSDLLGMVKHADDLMAELHLEIGQMSPQERDQALQSMSDIMLEMSRVVDTHARQRSAMGTPGIATRTPGAMMTPTHTPMPMMMGTATPTMAGAAMGPEKMMAYVDQLRDQMMRLAANQPTEDDLIALMDRLQLIMVAMRQQLGQLSTQDLEALTGNLSAAMDDLVAVMETHLRLETGSVPVVGSPTAAAVMSPTATMTPVLTATMTPIPTATMTPVPTATMTPVPTATPVPTMTPVPTATPVPMVTP